MKKIISLFISLCLLLVSNVVVFAEGDEKTTTVTYTPTESYEWSIPESVTATTEGADITCTITKLILANNDTLKITVSSKNGFKLKNGGVEIGYTLKKDEKVLENGNAAYEFESDTDLTTANTQIIKAYLSTLPNNMLVQAYTDTLTFTAIVTNQ